MAEQMAYNLEHDDIVNMVCGLDVGYDGMHWLDKNGWKKLYHYYGGFDDRFSWNRGELKRLSDTELLPVYLAVKQSG